MFVYFQLLSKQGCTDLAIILKFWKSFFLLIIFKWIIDSFHETSGFATIATQNLFLTKGLTVFSKL